LLRIVQQAERSTGHRAERDVRLKGDRVDIKVNVREAQGDTFVVDLNGEIDVYTSPKVKDAIGDLIDKGHYNLVINLEKVRYIDSTGLGVLIGGLKRVREHGGTVNLVCTNPQIKKIFDITGLVKIFGIYDDEDAAMKALV
jgi:anti-sigma B factor antagonist